MLKHISRFYFILISRTPLIQITFINNAQPLIVLLNSLRDILLSIYFLVDLVRIKKIALDETEMAQILNEGVGRQ